MLSLLLAPALALAADQAADARCVVVMAATLKTLPADTPAARVQAVQSSVAFYLGRLSANHADGDLRLILRTAQTGLKEMTDAQLGDIGDRCYAALRTTTGAVGL